MIIVFTGNGKGKTTAALGQAVRVLGRGKKAMMIQFIKGPWKSGEDEFVQKLKAQSSKLKSINESLLDDLKNLYDFDIKKMGLGFVGILGDQLPVEEHKKAAGRALDFFRKEYRNYNLFILDEINVALSLGLVEEKDVIDAIKDVPEEIIVVLTGRGAPPGLIERANLVTEMKEIKHPFGKGVSAKPSIEF